jgi:hypothetical protein
VANKYIDRERARQQEAQRPAALHDAVVEARVLALVLILGGREDLVEVGRVDRLLGEP